MSSRPFGTSGESKFAMYARGFRAQCDVIGALVMRELHTRYGRENIGYLWMILEPLLLAGAVALLHTGEKTSYGSDVRPVPFAIVGYCVFIMFRGMFTRAEGALESNMPLLYHRQVTIFDIMASRAVLETAGTSATLVILLSLAIALGIADPPARPLDMMIGVMLMSWFSFAASLLCLSFTHENRLAARIVHPATYILMPLSGAFYQVKWVPLPYRDYLMWFPLPQIFEEVRYGMFYAASDLYIDLGFICTCCMVMTYFGIVSINVTRRHVHLH